MTQYLLSGLIAALAAVILSLLGLILNRLGRLEEKLDSKVDKSFCDHQQEACQREFGQERFWEVFNHHSHTGLEADSKVTR